MKRLGWPFLLIGFCVLLTLIAISSLALQRRLERTREAVRTLQERNEQSTQVLSQLRSEIYRFAVLTRDYLLERSPEAEAEQRERLREIRASTQRHLAALRESDVGHGTPEMERLRQVIEDYWTLSDPVLDWKPEEKALQGPGYLRTRVAPQRHMVFQMTSDLEQLSLSRLRQEQAAVLLAQQDQQAYLKGVTAALLVIGAVVAFLSVARTRALETGTARQLEQIEHGARGLRRLSARLANAQEDERRSISRELHDQVGQMLTALRMELGNLEAFRGEGGGRFESHMAEARNLVEETLRTVRDISTGLRPSVLDQLGLAPALRWQAREFTRRSGVAVEVSIEGNFDKLPDEHRTCVYRVVQEALTNCARHAKANQIRIALRGRGEAIELSVQDDGVGFDVVAARAKGSGLFGIEERVRELEGRFEIRSSASKGTRLMCSIPAPAVKPA